MTRKITTSLTDDQKAFVVQRLACWDTPKQTADALREEYGVAITPQSVEAYDPNKRAGRALSPRWRMLFETTRDRFTQSLEDIPEAHKAVRISRLARMSRTAEARGNFVLAASLLKQIAREVGGIYTNHREVIHKEDSMSYLADLTDAQLDARIRELAPVFLQCQASSR